MPEFDLEAALAASPPPRYKKPSVFDNPRVAGWLATLLVMRDRGDPVSLDYIAETLTRGARVEGIIGPTDSIKTSNLRRHLKELRLGR